MYEWEKSILKNECKIFLFIKYIYVNNFFDVFF